MDDQAYADFVAGSHARLFNVAFALTGDRHDAEDLLQVTWEKVYAAWRRRAGETVEDPYAYARRTLTHAHVSERRRARWTRERTGDVPDRPDPLTGPVTDERLALQAALDRLPTRQRQAVVLRHLEDLSVAETAALMRCGTGTVKRSAYDGLRALRRELDPARTEQEASR